MTTLKKTVTDVSLVGIGNMFNAMLGFTFLVVVAKLLPLEELGKYALLVSLLTAVARAVDFGTNSLFVSDTDSGDESQKRDIFLITKILLFSFALPIGILMLNFLDLASPQFLLPFILGIVAYTINFSLYALYQKSEMYKQIILINTIPSIVKMVFAGIFYFNSAALNTQQAFSVFALSIFTSILVPLISGRLPYAINVKSVISGLNKSNIIKSLQILRRAVSPGISQIIYESWQTINNTLIKFFNTYSDIGIFSMANKISNIFTIVSFSIFTVLLPKNVKRRSKLEGYNFSETIIITFGVLAFSFLFMLIAGIFIKVLLGEKFNESVAFLNILIFSNALTAIQNYTENYFYVQNKTHILAYLNISRVLVFLTIAIAGFYFAGLIALAYANLITALYGLGFTVLLVNSINKRNTVS